MVAQQPDSALLADAMSRRNAGDFAAAAALLRPYSEQHPEDAQAARLLGETLYWLKQTDAARTVYEAALVRHPADDELRLTYGRMLVETLDARRARTVLSPLVGRSRGRAEALLGTSEYWSGDYNRAQWLFIRALRADSSLASARLQLYEIAAVTAPSLRVESVFAHDDQPLNRVGVAVGGEYLLMPNMRLKLRVEPVRYTSGDSITRTVATTDGALSVYAPRSGVETEMSGGAIRRENPGSPGNFTGSLSVGLRLPRHLMIRVRAARESYMHTLASLTTPVMTRTGSALLAWKDPRGWLGETGVQRQWYPDSNAVTAAWIWFLAPVVKNRTGEVQAGYVAAAQHADENRFVLARPEQQFPPFDPRFDMRGRYSPYYTPDHHMTHSVLLAATTRLGPILTLRTNASVGVRATEDAPVLFARPPASFESVGRTSYRRSFHPWSARGALDIARPNDWVVAITGEYQRTGYYSAGSAGLQLTHRFTRAAIRRVDRY